MVAVRWYDKEGNYHEGNYPTWEKARWEATKINTTQGVNVYVCDSLNKRYVCVTQQSPHGERRL